MLDRGRTRESRTWWCSSGMSLASSMNKMRSSLVVFPPTALWFILFKTSNGNKLKTANTCWSWKKRNTKINLSQPVLYIWSKCLDEWKGGYILSGLGWLYTCLYNIFLKVEAVHRLEEYVNILWAFVYLIFFFLKLALAWWFSVSLASHWRIMLQPAVASLFPPKKTSLATR